MCYGPQEAKAFNIKADLSGVNKQDMKVTVDGAAITIGVEQASSRPENTEEQGVRYAEVVECMSDRS